MGFPIQHSCFALHGQAIDVNENGVILNLPCGSAARKRNTHTLLLVGSLLGTGFIYLGSDDHKQNFVSGVKFRYGYC